MTGHCSSQARHVVHLQITSACSTFGTSSVTWFGVKYASLGGSAWCISCVSIAPSSVLGAAGSLVSCLNRFGSHAYRWSRSASVRCLGESFLSVVYAGQLSLQRPHSVHVYRSITSFHDRSVIFEK